MVAAMSVDAAKAAASPVDAALIHIWGKEVGDTDRQWGGGRSQDVGSEWGVFG